MINKDRIIPIEKTDYLSLIATIARLCELQMEIVPVTDGENPALEASGLYLATEPLKRVNIGSVAGAVLCFVPAHDFEGIYNGGVLVTEFTSSSDDVIPDGVSLYKAGYEGSAGVGVYAVTPQAE